MVALASWWSPSAAPPGAAAFAADVWGGAAEVEEDDAAVADAWDGCEEAETDADFLLLLLPPSGFSSAMESSMIWSADCSSALSLSSSSLPGSSLSDMRTRSS